MILPFADPKSRSSCQCGSQRRASNLSYSAVWVIRPVLSSTSTRMLSPCPLTFSRLPSSLKGLVKIVPGSAPVAVRLMKRSRLRVARPMPCGPRSGIPWRSFAKTVVVHPVTIVVGDDL